MTWKVYELTYRARSPVLLGGPPLGFVQRTRYFAPGWTLWGALTARITRCCLPAAGGADYQAVGDFVANNLPMSSACILADGKRALPNYRQGVRRYGDLREGDFERRYVTSLGQTGVAPATMTAQTGALHETEALSNRDLLTGEPVRWRYDLYVRTPWQDPPPFLEGLTCEDVPQALAEITLGADRGYGLGWLERESILEKEAEGAAWPRPLGWQPCTALEAYLPVDELRGQPVYGEMALVERRLWRNCVTEEGSAWGPGQERTHRLYYVPGSWVDDAGWQPVVGAMGIWQTEAPADV